MSKFNPTDRGFQVVFDNGWTANVGNSITHNHLVITAFHADGRFTPDKLIDPDGIGDALNEIKAMDKSACPDPLDRIIAAVRANNKVVTPARIDNLKAERDSLMASYCRAEETTRNDDDPVLVGLRKKIAAVNAELAEIETANVAAFNAARQPT